MKLFLAMIIFSGFGFALEHKTTCNESIHVPTLSVTHTAADLIAFNGFSKFGYITPVKQIPSSTLKNFRINYFPWSVANPQTLLAVYNEVSSNGLNLVPKFAIYSNPPVFRADVLDQQIQGLVVGSTGGKLHFSKKAMDRLAFQGLLVLQTCK